MSEKVITPDLKFVNDVIASGGDSLKKCFQCATCTVVCNVTPEEKPFPRKEMVQAQWGLKEDLMANPDIWLCHQCSDCTAHCPRGAKPGEVLGAVRKISLEEFAAPRALSKLVGSPMGSLVLLLIPVLILLGLIGAVGQFPANLPLGDEVVYAEFAPTLLAIDLPFTAAFIFAAVVFGIGIWRYWKAMARAGSLQGSALSHIGATIGEILAHKRFDQCDLVPKRKTSHMLLLYSFIILAITTGIGFAREWGHLFGLELEHPLYIPMKIFGNVGALALVVGLLIVIINRFVKADKLGIGSYFDWQLIIVIGVIALTGVLAQFLRVKNIAPTAYWVYFVHLVSVFFLFAYAPYSKMAHMVYRATAMVFAKASGRD